MAVYEEDIVLDADGKPVFSALEYVNAQVDKLQRTISQIGKDSFKNVEDVGKTITATVKELQQAMGQMRTLANAKNTPGSTIQDLNANRGLARATVEATKYAASLREGMTAAEALRAKLNDLDRAAAARGAAGQGATANNIRDRDNINAQIKQLQQLDAELAKLERRSGRTGGDFSAQRSAVDAARVKLQAAAVQPNSDLKNPLAAVIAAQDQYTAALDATRRKQAEALVASRAYYRQIEADELKARNAKPAQIANDFDARNKAALDAAALAKQKQADYDRALKAVSDGRAAQEAKGFATNDLANRVAAARALSDEEKLGAAQVQEMNRRGLEADREADRERITSAAAVGRARLEAAKASLQERARGINDPALLAAQKAEAEAGLSKLRAQASAGGLSKEESDRLQQLIVLAKSYNGELDKQIAKQERLQSAADRRLTGSAVARNTNADIYARDVVASSTPQEALIGARLEKELALHQYINAATEQEKREALDLLEIRNANLAAVQRIVTAQQREVEQERLANAEAQRNLNSNQRSLANRTANQRIAGADLPQAQAETLSKVAAAQERLAAANGVNDRQLREELAIEEAILREINKQVAAVERKAAQDARDAEVQRRKSLGGRVDTAVTNTLLYGTVAGIGYGAFNQVQQQISDMVRLEDEFVKLQAISDTTDTDMQKLKATIFEIGDSSRFSLIDIAKMAQNLAQAGVSASQMGDVLKAVTTLANASGSTPDESVQLVTAALGSFQLQASEAGRVADLLTSALNRTKLTVGQVAQAIQYVGSTAFEQNISLEQLLATVGAVSQAGVRSGSTIGTGFRQFLVDLQTPSEKLTKQLTTLGLTAADVDVSTLGLPAVLDNLKKAGFGAGQAYAGLETRAAAFYLTAKNNVDVMDQLQLSFAASGAAAVANDRAMNSLTAQWQRFINVVSDGLSGSFDKTTTILKNIVSALADRISEMKKESERLQEASTGDVSKQSGSVFGAPLGKVGQYANAALNYNLQPLFENALSRVLNIATPHNIYTAEGRQKTLDSIGSFGGDAAGGLGTNLKGLEGSSAASAAASEKLATALADTSGKVDDQRNKISELEKEYQRLIVQKASLANNDLRSAAETANLTSRFQGLALYLDSTKTRYQSLTDAVLAFTRAQIGSLNQGLSADNANLYLSRADAQRTGGNAIQSLLKSSSPALSQQNRTDLQTLLKKSPNSQEGQNATERLSSSIPDLLKISKDIAEQVRTVVTSAESISQTTGKLITNKAEQAANSASGTKIGGEALVTGNEVQALITKLGSADRGDKDALAGQANAKLDKLDRDLAAARPRGGSNTKGDLQFLSDQRAEVTSLRQQIAAMVAETADEKKARQEAEREALKRPLVQQSDIDRYVNGGSETAFSDRIRDYGERSRADQVSPKGARGTMQVMAGTIKDPGFGVRPASDNSIAEIDRVGRDYSNALLKHYGSEVLAAAAYNWGVGKVDSRLKKVGAANFMTAPGLPKETRDYIGRVTRGSGDTLSSAGGYSIVGLSDTQAENKATAIRARLAAAGIEAQVKIDKGAKKIVVTYRPGTRFSKDQTDVDRDAYQDKLMKQQTQTDTKQFGLDLKALDKATSAASYGPALANAQKSMQAIAADLRAQAEKELSRNGFVEGDAEWTDKMDQVNQQIEQNFQSLTQHIADNIAKGITAQMKAAQTAFDRAMKPALEAQAVAGARVSGLSYASNDGIVPDYVTQLAQRSKAQSDENVDRATLANLPGQIRSDQFALSDAQGKLSSLSDLKAAGGPVDEGAYAVAQQSVDGLKNSIADLTAKQTALQTALSAGSQIPTTLSQGLHQAIDAYTQAHHLNNTFTQDLNLNLTGALDQLSSGFTEFFTSVTDGTSSVLGAFGNMARGILKYITQIAAQMLASKILGALFNLVGTGSGAFSGIAGASPASLTSSVSAIPALGSFTGGPAFPEGLLGGGQVSNGSDAQDSVTKRLAKGEWVINKKASDSVGPKFMAQLNQHGAAALQSLQSVPQITMAPKQEMAVYVVQPDHKPQMGKNDILLAVQEDILSGGETKKLIKYVGQGG